MLGFGFSFEDEYQMFCQRYGAWCFFYAIAHHGRGIARYFWRVRRICICYGPLNSESPMQSVGPGKVVSKFGKRKIGWVYYHCSGQLNLLQPAYMCKAKGRKRSGYFHWNVYSGPQVLLVASFPDLEDLDFSRQKVTLIISSANSWKERKMSWFDNLQNPLDQGVEV